MPKEILRSQFNSRKGTWQIVKKTAVGCGGWKRFGGAQHYSRPACDEAIERLCNDYPQYYEKESK